MGTKTILPLRPSRQVGAPVLQANPSTVSFSLASLRKLLGPFGLINRKAEADMAKALGFSGKAALHPDNLATINAAFTPTPQQIAHAEKVMALYEASPNGLAVLDGKLIEKPVIRQMQNILAVRDRTSL